MGIFDSWADLVAAATPWAEAEAEAVSGGTGTDSTPAQKDEGDDGAGGAVKISEDNGESSEKEKDDEPEAEDEEEEEEEMVDPKDKFEEECKESKKCAPVKHHFDECVERVTGNSDKNAPHEDCVEEFFHLAHCANECAAPKLWAALK